MAQPNLRRSNGLRLLDGVTASPGVDSDAAPGGVMMLTAECATWNGASVTLQFRGPNNTLIAVPGVSLSANGAVEVDVSVGAVLQAIITGSPSAPVYANLERVLA